MAVDITPLVMALGDAGDQVVRSVEEQLRQILNRHPEMGIEVLETAKTPQMSARGLARALRACQWTFAENKQAAELVANLIDHEDPEVRRVATETLWGAAEYPTVRKKLLQAASSDDHRLRHAAVQALKHVAGSGHVRQELLKRADDEHAEIRTAALAALFDPDVIDELAEVVSGESTGSDGGESRSQTRLAAFEAIDTLRSELSQLMSSDPNQVELGFLTAFELELDDFRDLIARSSPSTELEKAVSGLQRVHQAFSRISDARTEVVALTAALARVVNTAQVLF